AARRRLSGADPETLDPTYVSGLRQLTGPVILRVFVGKIQRFARWCPRESPQQREADLRALQGCQAQRRDSHHLQAQSQAQAAPGLIENGSYFWNRSPA